MRGLRALCGAALVWALATVPATAGWTRLGELPSSPGDQSASGLLVPNPGGPVLVESIASASTVQVHIGQVRGAGLVPLGPDPSLSDPRAAAGAELRAAAAPGVAVAAVAEKDTDGTHERLDVVRLVNGQLGGLGRIEAPNSEYAVEPTAVSVSPSGTVAVAYRAALTAGGAVHARVARWTASGGWQPLYPGSFFPAGPALPGTPADRVALAYDGESLDAAAGSASTQITLEQLPAGAAGWTARGSFGFPPLLPTDVLAGGGVMRVVAGGASLLVDAREQGTVVDSTQALPALGLSSALVGANGGPDSACGLLTGASPTSDAGRTAVACLDAGGLWQLVGPTVASGGQAIGGAGAAVSDDGAFAIVTAPDASGPHAAVYRLDPDVGATSIVSGSSTVSLVGAVAPLGRPTAAHFEYGPTTAYGSSTPVARLPGVTAPLPLSANLTGLAPETTYHYRLVTDNGAGPVAAGDQTFTTARDTRGPQVVFSVPGHVRLGARFTLRLRSDERGVATLALVDASLRRLRSWRVALPSTASLSPTPRALVLRTTLRPRLRPGHYLWLLTATDHKGNTTRFAPRTAVVFR